MSRRLHNRVALVTGAGNGIGKSLAILMALEGASIVVNDLGTDVQGQGRSSAAADATVLQIREAGGKAVANYDSVADPQGCKNAVATAITNFGSCDILVANAGALTKANHLQMESDDESFRQLLDLYIGQKFWLTREVLPRMLKQGWGRVIFASSEIARGKQHNPLGALVLSGAVGLSKDLAFTHKGSGVTFNCYAPAAATRTYDLYKDQIEAGLIASGIPENEVAAHHLPGPEHIAPLVTWLCTEAASRVTGEVFAVVGGSITRWSHMDDAATVHKGADKGAALWMLEELDRIVPQNLLPAAL